MDDSRTPTYLTPTFVMPNPEVLAREISEMSKQPYLEWFNALREGEEFAKEADLDPDAYITLTREADNPAQFLTIIEAMATYHKENPYSSNGFNLLVLYIDKAPFSLNGWMQGIEYFYSWLTQKGRTAGFAAILNYISGGIEESDKMSIQGSLRDIIARMLDAYGFPE